MIGTYTLEMQYVREEVEKPKNDNLFNHTKQVIEIKMLVTYLIVLSNVFNSILITTSD